MRKSTNLQLKLPDNDDFFNIEDFNENSEIIDRKLTEFNNKLPELEVNSEQIKEELKTQAEELLNKQRKDVDRQLSAFKSEVSAKQEELNQALTKAIKDIADSKGASETTFNPDGSIVTVNSLETITTNINKAEKSITSKHDFKNGFTKTLKTVFEGKKIITTEVK